jgi:hypothetical protein
MQGAQASDFLFARSYLPWENRTHPESDDFLVRLNASGWQSDKEKFPGLLIFRPALPPCLNDATKPLFVFLVGDRPTSGINKLQFQSALRIMAAIRGGNAGQTSDDPLLILGPDFSGSLYSLAYLLAHDPANRSNYVTVHSGRVTSYSTVSWFQKFAHGKERHTYFRSFLESDLYQKNRFLSYAICEQHYVPSDVVILTEDETAYGQPAVPQKLDVENDQLKCADKFAQISNIFFPRDISHLRSAYQQQSQAAAASDAGNRSPRTTLPLNIEDTGNDDDSVPTYSPGQTPLSEESILLGVVSTLHKQHAKFIILIATNPLDTIFLSQYLRRAYPQGRIVTLDQDLLLSREVNDPHFRGILSVTSEPLFPGTDDEVAVPANSSQGNSPHHEFPSDRTAGTYNAMVALLANPHPTCDEAHNPWTPPDKCPDLPAVSLAGYGWPTLGGAEDLGKAKNLLAPPLWLTVIGNDGYWPVEILDSERYAKYGGDPASLLHAINSTPQPAPPSPVDHAPWDMLCTIFIGAIVIYLFLRLTGSPFART